MPFAGKSGKLENELGRNSASLGFVDEAFLFGFVSGNDPDHIACEPGGLQFYDSFFGSFAIV
jgi:hypothetical protein